MCDRPPRESKGVIRIEADRLRVGVDCGLQIFRAVPAPVELRRSQVGIKGSRIARAADLDLRGDIAKQCDLEGFSDSGGNLSLQLQYVTQVSIVGLRPDVKPCAAVNQLRRDADGVRGPADAALQDRRDVEFVCNRADVRVLSLE